MPLRAEIAAEEKAIEAMIKVKEAKDAELSISSAQLRAHKKVSNAMCSGCLQHSLLFSFSPSYSITHALA